MPGWLPGIDILEQIPVTLSHFSRVMAGPPSMSCLLRRREKDVDARGKRGHDGGEVIRSHRNAL
jgi:hypothetical protein